MTVQARLPARAIVVLLAAAIIGPLLLLPHWEAIRAWQPWGIRWLVDAHDTAVYFRSSAWVVGGGTLYVDVPSEYPLVANLVFAAVRLVSEAWRPMTSSYVSFEFTWAMVAWWGWLATLLVLWRRTGRRTVWLWLTPAAIYFSLYRYDVYPVLATLLALVAARDRRVRTAAIWLGVAIAFKGYALYFVPAFGVWVWQGWGRREAVVAVAIVVAPLALSLAAVLALSGVSAMTYPFRVQAVRGTNHQSSWDVLRIVLDLPVPQWVERFPMLPLALGLAPSVVAAALRPRTFDALVGAFVLSIGGLVTFSVFYSPQFVLWFVPAAAVSGSLVFEATIVFLGWITILYFPILSDVRGAALRAAVVVVTVVRSAAFVVGAFPLVWRQDAARTGSAAGPPDPGEPPRLAPADDKGVR